jgi:hypothetical protein
MRTHLGILASLLLCAPTLAVSTENKPKAPDVAIEFLLGGVQWQPGDRYRSGNSWLALVCGKTDCRFEPAKLTVRREKWQGHYDEQPTTGQKLLFRRQTTGTGTVLAWFKLDPGAPWLQAGTVATHWAASYKKKRPTTEGTLELAVDLPKGKQATLVPLFDPEGGRFLLQLRTEGKRQLLDELGQCSHMVSTEYLVWVGDLDQDGHPDYLINFADEVGEAKLYLSLEAGRGEIAGVAAVYVPPPFGGECDGEGWVTR